MNKFKSNREKATINQVHQAFIYGVNLTQVPSLNDKFNDMKKNIKEKKIKKQLRKTMQYFRRIDKANKSLLIPLP